MKPHWIKKLFYFFFKKKINRVKSYIAGEVSEAEFFSELTTCKTYQHLYYRVSWYSCSSPIVERKLIFGDLKNLSAIEKIGLQKRLVSILDYYCVEYVIGISELAFWRKWEGYIPSFLDPSLDLMEEMERIDPERKHTKKWHRERFAELYPWEKYPPRWLQRCEWPLDESGKFCLFLYQTGFPNSKDFIEYHFRKSNGEEVVIKQYD